MWLGAVQPIVCVTLSPCGAQAGVMPSLGQQLMTAAGAGRVDEMKTLIAAGANVEKSGTVSLKMAQGCHVRNDECMRAWKWPFGLNESARGFRARWPCGKMYFDRNLLGDGF